MTGRIVTRVVPGREAGYARGWVAQYRDPTTNIWFDIGDPEDTLQLARAKAARFMR